MTAPDKIWAYSYDVNTSQGPLDVWKTINTWSDATVQPITAVEYTRTSLAQAAVAAAYEAAANVAASHAKYTRVAIIEATAKAIVENLVSVTQTKTANAIEDAIRALATPDQSAALAAERATTVTVNKLPWESRRISSNWERLTADTLFGGYEILEHTDGKISWNVTFFNADEPYLQYAAKSIEAAQAAAQADYDARIRSAITITSGDAEITRLRAVIAKDAAQMIEDQHKMHKAAEVLRWYAEQARLCRLIHGEGDAGRSALAADGGAKANAVLAEIGGA